MDFETHLALCDAAFWAVAAGLVAWAAPASGRAARMGRGAARALSPPLLAAGLLVAAAFLLAPFAPGVTIFAVVRYGAFGGMIAFPILAAATAAALRRPRPRLAAGLAVLALFIGALGVDAFLIEPRRLMTVVHRIEAPSRARLLRPIRIAHATDIQTDRVGAHEERALGVIASFQPDLLILTGDFVQVPDREDYRAQAERLRPMLARAAASARYGAFAVWGNVDPRDGLPELLRGTGIALLEDESVVVDVGGVPLRVTGLSLESGFEMEPEALRPLLPPPPEGGLHLAIAHGPDFAAGAARLGTVDLALAGHTHGGQVVVPGFGPPMTLSKLPRHMASGLSWLSGMPLVVSRGVGLERSNAPRIRIFCPPEVTRVEWVPAGGGARISPR